MIFCPSIASQMPNEVQSNKKTSANVHQVGPGGVACANFFGTETSSTHLAVSLEAPHSASASPRIGGGNAFDKPQPFDSFAMGRWIFGSPRSQSSHIQLAHLAKVGSAGTLSCASCEVLFQVVHGFVAFTRLGPLRTEHLACLRL